MQDQSILFTEGNKNATFAHPRAGMTNSSILIMEKLLTEGYQIFSNIELVK